MRGRQNRVCTLITCSTKSVSRDVFNPNSARLLGSMEYPPSEEGGAREHPRKICLNQASVSMFFKPYNSSK